MFEILAKLDDRKRISAAVLTTLLLAFICYYAITRKCIGRLDTARADNKNLLTAYSGTESQRTDYLSLQTQLENQLDQLAEHKQRCFSSERASQFVENINAMAQTYSLKPVSRVISKPQSVLQDDTNPEQESLKIQKANVTVAGHYFDIVDFVKDLTNRPEKVCIKNLSINLPPREDYTPRATFQVALLIDSGEEIEK